ncbi:MAG: HD domain-containing protein [Anaeroplasmataceae bacterium]
MEEIVKRTLFVKVEQIMISSNMINALCSVANEDMKYNFKIEIEKGKDIYLNCIYEMTIASHSNSDRNSGYILEYRSVNDIEDIKHRNDIYRSFMKSAPINYEELKSRIESYIERIDNPILSTITKELITTYQYDFYLYPAASKLHHAYVGGLAYHTLGMLDLVDGIANNYPYIDKNYMYSGIILHDIGKVIEFTGVQNTEYALEGQLLGHLLIGCNCINDVARKYGYENSEEVLLLEHMIASHHGQPIYGAIKKPVTPEAALLWYIDTIDSKFRVLGEDLEKTKPGEFTEPVSVFDRTKFYKKK